MKKAFIKQINELIVFEKMINQIIIEDSIIYRNIVFNEIYNIILSENNTILDNKKSILYIINPLELDINDKKNLSLLYKELLIHTNDEVKQIIGSIEKEILDLFEILSINSNCDLTFQEELDINKLFSIYQLSYSQKSKDAYLEYLLSYIKINTKVNNYKLIVSVGLLNLLNNEEIDLLEKELRILNIHLLDISAYSNRLIQSYLIIDKDQCII